MSSYTVRVDWLEAIGADRSNAEATAARAEHIMDPLEQHHAVITIRRDHDTADATAPWSAILTVDATTPRNAMTAAVGAVESATGVRANGFEVLTTEEFDRLQAHPPIPDLVGNSEIADLLGVSRQRVGQLAELDDFPPVVVATKNGNLRVRRQVEGWARSWERRNGRPPRADEPTS